MAVPVKFAYPAADIRILIIF